MVERKRDYLQLATGPYVVNKATAPTVAEVIKYRHYKPEELQLAKDFVRRCYLPGNYFFDVYLLTYSAKVIEETMAPPALSDIVPWMMRIDCVVVKPGRIWILEIKQRLRAYGLGQLDAYKQLYQAQFHPTKEISLGYVCRDDDPTLHTLLALKGIRLWVVPVKERE